jgi:hypothetical protein
MTDACCARWQERRRGDDQLRGQLPQREYRIASDKATGGVVAQLAALSRSAAATKRLDARVSADQHRAMMKGEIPKVTWEKIIEHIDHAVKVAGADHVGLGSTDGATLPSGWKTPRSCEITDAAQEGYSGRTSRRFSAAPARDGAGRGSKGVPAGSWFSGSWFSGSWFSGSWFSGSRFPGSGFWGSWFPATSCMSLDTDGASCLHRLHGRLA